MPLPPPATLRAFEAAARLESFVRAAGELNVSAAAVSQHVRTLELWLGQPLFRRHAQGVALTAAGRELGAAVTDGLTRIAAAADRLRRDTASAKGSTVTVQISSGPGDIDVPKLIGINVTKAQKDLETLGLKPTLRWVELAETQTMVVLNQKPAAGQKVKPGSEVQLTINR